MNKICPICLIGPIAIALLLQTGCASYMVARNSAEKRALRLGVNSRGEPEASVDLLSLGTLSEQPWQQLGAALLDIGVGIAAADAATGGGVVGWFGDGNGTSDDNSTRITINGDGNVVNTADLARQMQDNSTTTTTGF